MALNDIKFQVLDGGLGRVLAGDDSVSGFVVSNTVHPGTLAKTIVVYSLTDAETQGIVATGVTAELHYHITNFYDQVAAALYITFSAGNFAQDLQDLQNFAQGAIRQVAVVDGAGFETSALATLNTAAELASSNHAGFSVLYSGHTATALASLPDLTTFNYPKVSVVIGSDAGTTTSCIGAALGVLALSKVSENIGWVGKFNVVKTGEFDNLGFITGDAYTSVSDAQLSQLRDKGYIFLRKYAGRAGSYFSDSNTATSVTSDFAYIENVRTMEKAQRGIRAALLPELGSPLKTTSGKLSVQTTTKFDLLVRNYLEVMQVAGEINEFSIFIDRTQNVLATSSLTIQVGIVPQGVTRQIFIPIGLQIKVS